MVLILLRDQPQKHIVKWQDLPDLINFKLKAPLTFKNSEIS